MARYILIRDSSAGHKEKQSAIDALYIRSGVTSLSNGVSTVTVSFSSTVPDTNYSVSCLFINSTDTNVQYQPITITARTTSGFTAKWNSAVDSANYSLMYQTMPLV